MRSIGFDPFLVISAAVESQGCSERLSRDNARLQNQPVAIFNVSMPVWLWEVWPVSNFAPGQVTPAPAAASHSQRLWYDANKKVGSRTLWLHVLEPTTCCFGPIAQDRSIAADSPKPTSQHQNYLPVKATNQLPKNIGKHKPQRAAILSSVSWCRLVLTEEPSGSFVSAVFVCPFLRFAANVRISSVLKFNVRKGCIGLGFWSAFQLQSSPSR